MMKENVDLIELPKVSHKGYIHWKSFLPEEIIPLIGEDTKKEFTVGDQTFIVNLSSGRLQCFTKSLTCVKCGRVGNIMSLDSFKSTSQEPSAHINLYCQEGDKFYLMTKDHIVPKAKGGKDCVSNYQTMCEICNAHKGSNQDRQFEICMRDFKELTEVEEALEQQNLKYHIIEQGKGSRIMRFYRQTKPGKARRKTVAEWNRETNELFF